MPRDLKLEIIGADHRLVSIPDQRHNPARPKKFRANLAAVATSSMILISDDGQVEWWDYKDRPGPPDTFYQDVKMIAGATYSFLALKTDGTLQLWARPRDTGSGVIIELSEMPPNIVEIDAGANFYVCRSEAGKVFTISKEGRLNFKSANLPHCTPPPDLTDAIAVRAGGHMAAAQRPDLSWIAWGSVQALIARVASIGPALDLDLWGTKDTPTETNYILWIEPKDKPAALTPKPSRQPKPPTKNTALAPNTAAKDKPFVNSLKMRFVPVPITGGPTDGQRILFSVWETRRQDYAEFIRDDPERGWPNAPFEQRDEHPAVNVNWEDAKAFCAWLTAKDRKKGLIGSAEAYRLPSDHEWSCAVGIGDREDPDAIPVKKSQRIKGVYPWGAGFPPPEGAGNYAGEEIRRNRKRAEKGWLEGYDDGYEYTAPVGSFTLNPFGLYDLGGNVEEWCEDIRKPDESDRRVVRGAQFALFLDHSLNSSYRYAVPQTAHHSSTGFRCVLTVSGD